MKDETDELMDAEGWAFFKATILSLIVVFAVIAAIVVVILTAIALPVAIAGALKMIGGSV